MIWGLRFFKNNSLEACPFVRGARRAHQELDDPDKFEGSKGERLEYFRRIRDEINTRLKD